MQNEQIPIAGDENVRVTSLDQRKKGMVHGVTAGRLHADFIRCGDLDQYASLAQNSQELLTYLYRLVAVELVPQQNRFQLDQRSR
jgi:hypothetical protein